MDVGNPLCALIKMISTNMNKHALVDRPAATNKAETLQKHFRDNDDDYKRRTSPEKSEWVSERKKDKQVDICREIKEIIAAGNDWCGFFESVMC